jgi:hypothetical protein
MNVFILALGAMLPTSSAVEYMWCRKNGQRCNNNRTCVYKTSGIDCQSTIGTNCHCGGRITRIDFTQLKVPTLPTIAPAEDVAHIITFQGDGLKEDYQVVKTLKRIGQECNQSSQNICESNPCIFDGLAEEHILHRFKFSKPACVKATKIAKSHHDCDLDCDYLYQKWNKAGNNIGASTIGLIFALLVLAQ